MKTALFLFILFMVSAPLVAQSQNGKCRKLPQLVGLQRKDTKPFTIEQERLHFGRFYELQKPILEDLNAPDSVRNHSRNMVRNRYILKNIEAIQNKTLQTEWRELRFEIARRNMGLVYRALMSLPTKDPVLLEDLLSVGTEELMHSIDRFDPTFGYRFGTYVGRNIKKKMIDAWTQRQRQRMAEIPGGAESLRSMSASWTDEATFSRQLVMERALEAFTGKEKEALARVYGLLEFAGQNAVIKETIRKLSIQWNRFSDVRAIYEEQVREELRRVAPSPPQ
jgi:RNA polymerase sigma factor (sigma-70 family)